MAIQQDPRQTFVWGGNGQAMTPEQVARQRDIAQAMMMQGADYSPVQHWLQGASRAVQGALGGWEYGQANRAEREGREAYQSEWDKLFGGSQAGGANPIASELSGGGVSPVAIPTGENAAYIREGLISRGMPEHIADAFLLNMQDESGLNAGINERAPTVPGSRGGFGLYQLTGPRRTAYEAYAQGLGLPLDSVDAQLDFLMSELSGPEAAANKAIMAAPDTGTAAAAIVNQFLRPAEQHRARREAAYLGGAAPRTQVASAGGGSPSMAELLGLASNEWASPAQQSIVQSLLGQQMQQQDPRYQQQLALGDLQRQQAEMELERLRTPAAPAPIEVGGVLVDPVTFQPLFDSRGEGGFTLSPGQQRFDQFGNPIASAAPEEGFTQLTPEQAVSANLDPKKSWQVGPDGRIHEIGNSGVNITNTIGGEQTPGWKKIDETFGETYLDWVSGGWADTSKQIDQLSEALNILGQGGDVTGAIGLLPREMGAFFNPDGTVARENVEEVVQRSLREILGAQFTEKEGERLIARAFNPLLSPAENTKRVTRLMDTIRGMADSKQAMVDYFDQNGTLRGYQGQRVNSMPLDQLMNDFGEAPNESAPKNQSEIQTLTQEQFNAAPSGTVFKAPDGSIRVKP